MKIQNLFRELYRATLKLGFIRAINVIELEIGWRGNSAVLGH